MEDVVRGRIDLCRMGGGFENVTVDYTANPTIPLVGQTGRNKKEVGEKAGDTLFGPAPRITYRPWVIGKCDPC